MCGLVWRLFAGDPFPDRLAGAAIEGEDDVLVCNAGLRTARRMLRSAVDTDRHGACHVYPVAPNHGRTRAAPRQLGLPSNVLRLTPFDGWICGARHSGALGTAPLRPEPIR